MTEHAVIVNFKYQHSDLALLSKLEDALKAAIIRSKVGEYDGNEFAVDGSRNAVLYVYGPDADRLFAPIEPILIGTKFMADATITRRYGPPEDGVRQVTTEIA